MKCRTFLIALSVLSLSSVPSFSQDVCGDVNGNGVVSIGDLVQTLTYLWQGPPTTIDTSADCDNRYGITIGDVEAMTRYLFYGDYTLDCFLEAPYGMASAPNDTVFLPFMVAIPDEVDSVFMPVITSFASDTRAFYIPCQTFETNGPGLFEFRSVTNVEDFSIGMGMKDIPDTAIMQGTEVGLSGAVLGGRHTFFGLVFHRIKNGLAAINCNAVLRSQQWIPTVEKNGDLYKPVIQYYQLPLPTPVVTTTPSSLSMDAEAGFWSTASYPVSFTSNMGPVSFKVTASDNWIVIQDPSPTGYTTPATFNVRANAMALTAGSYAGQITFSEVSPADADFIPPAIDITLTVTPSLVYPPGDLNCDGQVSIGDIVLMIDCLFINTRPIPTCE